MSRRKAARPANHKVRKPRASVSSAKSRRRKDASALYTEKDVGSGVDGVRHLIEGRHDPVAGVLHFAQRAKSRLYRQSGIEPKIISNAPLRSHVTSKPNPGNSAPQ